MAGASAFSMDQVDAEKVTGLSLTRWQYGAVGGTDEEREAGKEQEHPCLVGQCEDHSNASGRTHL